MKTERFGLKSGGGFSTFRALQYRDFRLLWISLLVSNAGTWMQMVAQGWLVYELTRSAFYLGLVGLMQAVPRFAFSLFGGAAADRLDRKRLLCFTQTAAMSLALILAVLAYAHFIRIWHILAVSFFNSLVMTFDQPARQALVSDLVEGEDLVNAIALNSMAFNGAAVFGPSLGGFLLATIGAPGCFFVNGVSFLAVIGALVRMEVPPEKRDRLRGQGGLRGEIAEGLAVVRSSRSLAGLLFLIAALSFFGRPYNQLMPVFAKDVLRVGPRGLGLLMAAPGIGTVIGSLALASAGPKLNLGRLSIAAALTFSAALTGFSRLRFFPLDLAFLMVVGMGQTVAMAATNTTLQTSVEPGLRGRVISMYTMLNMGLNPMGTLFGGALAASWGAPAVVCGGGVVVAAVAFFVACWAREITGLSLAGMRQHPPEGLRPSRKNKNYKRTIIEERGR